MCDILTFDRKMTEVPHHKRQQPYEGEVMTKTQQTTKLAEFTKKRGSSTHRHRSKTSNISMVPEKTEMVPKRQSVILSGPYEETPDCPQRLVSLYHNTVRVYNVTDPNGSFYMLQMHEHDTTLELFKRLMIYVHFVNDLILHYYRWEWIRNNR